MLKHMMKRFTREVDEDEYMSQKSPKVDKEFGYGAYSYDEIDNNDYPQTYDSNR